MSTEKFSKNSTLWQLFADFWGMCQELWGVEDNDAYWNEVVTKTRKFAEKYNGYSFAERLASALVDELEHKSKNNRKSEL